MRSRSRSQPLPPSTMSPPHQGSQRYRSAGRGSEAPWLLLVPSSSTDESGGYIRFERADLCWLDRPRLTRRFTRPIAHAGEAAL